MSDCAGAGLPPAGAPASGFEAEELIERQAESAGEAHVQEVSPRGPAEVRGIIIPTLRGGLRHAAISCVWHVPRKRRD